MRVGMGKGRGYEIKSPLSLGALMGVSMQKHRFSFCTILIAFLAVLVLTSCGGGGGATGTAADPSNTVQTTVVEGIAAASAPMTGVVYLSDSMFLNYSTATSKKPITAPINQDGTFSIDVSGLKAPFMLRAVDNSGNILYSFAKTSGTANINPITNLAVAIAAGATSMQGLDGVFISHNSASMVDIANALPRAIANISSSLQPLLSLYGAETADPFSGPYQVNSQGLDGLFDEVSFSISGATVTITRSDTNTTVFSSPVSILNFSANSAGLNPNNLPTPTSYPTPGNAELTLQVQGNLPQGTLIKNVTFSLQLPLGVTVDIDPSDPTGLNAAVNTAIPIGLAAGSNVYPSPSLSATNNILTISMSSLDGFNTGEFLTIRLLFPDASLFSSTTANSFTVTASKFFSDIYKNNILKGLTITPVSLVH